MADKNIGLLPVAQTFDDDSKMVAEQQGEAVQITGGHIKKFARDSVSDYVETAIDAADAAAKSADRAADAQSAAESAQSGAETAQSAAESAQSGAEAAQAAAEGFRDDAAQIKADTQSLKDAVATSEENAAASAAAAKADRESVDQSKTAVMELAEQVAQDKQSAESAKDAAEDAQSGAEAAKSAAAGSAESAAESADTAKQYSGKPPIVQAGNWWTWNADTGEYQDTGKRAVLGFDKTYTSVAEMETDKDNQPAMTTAIISSTIDEPDNAKLYIHNGTDWVYLTDLSGFTGVGVENITQTSGNHAPGTTDVWTITLTDGRTFDIPIYNGKDGEGAGDMLSSVYDPQGKATDIFAYVDNKKIDVDAVPTQGSENAVSSGGVYDALADKQDKLTGTAGQVVGFDVEGNAVPITRTETDPTVPAWAKATSKPTYTASEVGAVPTTRTVNNKALSANISLNAADVGARPADTSSATGANSTALGTVATASSNNSTALGAYANATSIYSTALGHNAKATGNYSTAVGSSTNVGNYSIAVGYSAKASSTQSIALGGNANANNAGCIAVGYSAKASGDDSTALGYYANASVNAIALGRSAKATGNYSTALGYYANASGDYSTAVGSSANASGDYSTAVGSSANAVGVYSTALGSSTRASGFMSTAVGYNAQASGNNSIALGLTANASGTASTALGYSATASKTDSTALGHYTNATGVASTAIGFGARASGLNSTALGCSAVTANEKSIQLGDAANLSSLTCKVALTVTSDERDKTDITEISDGATEFLKKIKAITYVYNQRELYRPTEPERDEEGNPIIKDGVDYLTDEDRDNLSKYGFCRYDEAAHAAGGKKGTRRRAGVLAQEVQKAMREVYGNSSYANLVNDNLYDFDKVPEGIENQLGVSYENFIPFLIKAVQEIDARLLKIERGLSL